MLAPWKSSGHFNMTNLAAVADHASSDHRKQLQGRSKKQHISPPPPSSPPLCEKSSAAAVDIVILVLVLGACAFLFTPYFSYLFKEVCEILPLTLQVIGEVIYQAPVAYISGAVLMFALVIGACEWHQHKSRKCNNPKCRGLKKAMEFDIQLESEDSAKSSSQEHSWKGTVELAEDHKELEAELRRMAPPNGKAVLTFRSRCGCPAARMEVWGSKKPRKVKK